MESPHRKKAKTVEKSEELLRLVQQQHARLAEQIARLEQEERRLAEQNEQLAEQNEQNERLAE